MFQVYSCINCHSIISTSLNADYLILRYESCIQDAECLKSDNKIPLFVLDKAEYSLSKNELAPLEFVVEENEIKCKKCRCTIGEIYNEVFVLELWIGTLYKDKVKCFDVNNEYKKDIKVYSQFESDTVTSVKEIKTLMDTLKEYSELIMEEDIVKTQMELNVIYDMIDKSNIDALKSLSDEKEK